MKSKNIELHRGKKKKLDCLGDKKLDIKLKRFELIDKAGYYVRGRFSKSKEDKVYYCLDGSLKEIKNADPNNFKLLNKAARYTSDKKRVYFCGSEIADAKPKSFEYLRHSYSKDKNNIYYENKKLNGADPDTFEVLYLTGYAKDDENVYFRDKKLKGADSESFEIVYGYCAKDKNNLYYMGEDFASSEISVDEKKAIGNAMIAKMETTYKERNFYRIGGEIAQVKKILDGVNAEDEGVKDMLCKVNGADLWYKYKVFESAVNKAESNSSEYYQHYADEVENALSLKKDIYSGIINDGDVEVIEEGVERLKKHIAQPE